MKGFLGSFMPHVPPVTPTEEQLNAIRSLYESQRKKKEEEEKKKKIEELRAKEEQRKEYLQGATLTSEGYNIWLKKDTWSLEEGVALFFGKDPKKVDYLFFNEEMREVRDLANGSVFAKKLPATMFYGRFNIEVPKFLTWALGKNLSMPEELKLKAEELKNKEENTSEAKAFTPVNSKLHGNSIHHAKVHKEVLGAALSVVVGFKDKCVDRNGNVKGSKVAKLINDKASLFWPNTEKSPMTQDPMGRLINSYLKKCR